MDKLTRFIENTLSPLSNKIAQNKYLIALSHGLMCTLPIVIAGSMCIIIADFPLPMFQDFMTSMLGDVWLRWAWDIVVPATIGIMSLIAIIGITNSLATQNGVDYLPAIVTALASYFVLLIRTEDGAISASSFEAQSLFMAIITALIVSEIYAFLIKRNVRIKMPESVPSFVSSQFSAVVPAFIIVLMFLIIKLLFELTPYGDLTTFILHTLQQPLLGFGSSFIGVIVASLFNSFFWFFGIHGTAVVGAVMDPIWFQAQFQNLEVFKQGAELMRPYIATMDFANFFIYLGGTGLTFPLTLLMIFKCRSKQLQSLGRLSVLPGLFNVNEPVIFGLPLVMNPTMMIPFILAPLASIVLAWVSIEIGWVPRPTGVNIPWTTPLFIAGWLMTNSWRGGVLQLIVTVVSGVIYYPFIMTMDHQILKTEQLSHDDVETAESVALNVQ